MQDEGFPRRERPGSDETFGAGHGYDVTIPASPTARQVCVTAVRIGSVAADIKIPMFASFGVSVTGSATFVQKGSTSDQVTFSWQQSALVPVHSKVVANVAVTRAPLVVPYTMTGNAVYSSGAQAPWSVNGTYSGVNSHDLEATLTQCHQDGTPSANPVQQPAATLL